MVIRLGVALALGLILGSGLAEASEGRILIRAVESLVGRYALSSSLRAREFSGLAVEKIQRTLGMPLNSSEPLGRLLRRLSAEELAAIQNLDEVKLLKGNLGRMESRLRSQGLLGTRLTAAARERLLRMADELFPRRVDFLARVPEGSLASTAESFLAAETGGTATTTAAKIFNRDELLRLLNARGVRARDVLPQLRGATSEGLVADEAVVRYMKLDGMPVVGAALRFSPGLRNRILADPAFFMKLAVEQAIGVTTTIASYYTTRPGEEFWNSMDLITVDVVSVMFVDFALVYFLTPQLAHRLRPKAQRTGWLNRGRDYLSTLPQNAFEANVPGGSPYSLGQRVSSFLYKSGQFAVIGGAAGLAGTALTHGIYEITGQERGELPDPLQNGAQWGAFLASSSNSRYQLLAGVERGLQSVLGKRPVLLMLATAGIRYGNSYIGGLHWLQFTGRNGSPERPAVSASSGGEVSPGEIAISRIGTCLGGEPDTQPGSVGCSIQDFDGETCEAPDLSVLDLGHPSDPMMCMAH
ncbi:MAG: RETICULATA-related protein [Bdellovibrionales bacterium]|nr:RETICULATA-related protein [Bdellovibrionales bacterium]